MCHINNSFLVVHILQILKDMHVVSHNPSAKVKLINTHQYSEASLNQRFFSLVQNANKAQENGPHCFSIYCKIITKSTFIIIIL